MGTTKNLV